mmetsp:Transcript_60228/g.143558  ORF Transcript_60228/g.143558 Transcript_60228/m.143558 type:complete len:446 (+) Transcript_60228:80-1417(+)
MGKAGKKDPNAPTLIPEDVFLRARKLVDNKVTAKQPKGELTSEEWCIPPVMHSMPELKQTIHFWQNCATVAYAERDMKVPARVKTVESDTVLKKPHPRKEIQDLCKYLKTQSKAAAKRTGQFLKQLEKKETKETKREGLLAQIKEVDNQMNEELRSSRRFAETQQLFNKRFMIGSKLFDPDRSPAPIKNALIVCELSDKQAQWVDEMKDEVIKLLNGVINEETDTFNIATFSAGGVNTWCPQFQPKTDPKKGLPDAAKWLNKNVTAKACNAQPFPPDYATMISRFTSEGVAPPMRIFLCCSRSPDHSAQATVELVAQLRQALDPPMKGEPVLPINVVAFDPSIVSNAEEQSYFEKLAGPHGTYMFDTSAEDLVALDKMLKAVQAKKKQLDKLQKKLEKMEDLSERVAEDRRLLQVQMALQSMLVSDFEVCDWALKYEPPILVPEI